MSSPGSTLCSSRSWLSSGFDGSASSSSSAASSAWSARRRCESGTGRGFVGSEEAWLLPPPPGGGESGDGGYAYRALDLAVAVLIFYRTVGRHTTTRAPRFRSAFLNFFRASSAPMRTLESSSSLPAATVAAAAAEPSPLRPPRAAERVGSAFSSSLEWPFCSRISRLLSLHQRMDTHLPARTERRLLSRRYPVPCPAERQRDKTPRPIDTYDVRQIRILVRAHRRRLPKRHPEMAKRRQDTCSKKINRHLSDSNTRGQSPTAICYWSSRRSR